MSAPRTILMGISPITADDLCRAVRDQAQDYFKDEAEAIELLAEWGIRTSEDVGKIVFGLVKRGILIPTGTDRIEDFAGKFSLSDLFSRPM